MKIKKNLTSIFFVPTLKINREGLNSNGYLNGYSQDIRREVQYENCIYLLFKPKNLEKFKDFLDFEYQRTKQVIDDYDYEDGFIVVVYQLSEKFKNDYKLIKKGKYSQTSPEFQELFPKTLPVVKNNKTEEEVSLQYRIFNKTVDLKEYWENKLNYNFGTDMEVWSTWDDEVEIMDLEKIKELV